MQNEPQVSRQSSLIGAAALAACSALAAGIDPAEAALNVGEAPKSPEFSFPDSDKLFAQISNQMGVESERPSNAVGWKVAYILDCSYSKYPCASVSDAGGAHASQMITNRVLSQVLLGENEQVNCSNCVSAFGSVGSYSAGAHGRYNLTSQLSFLGGVAFSKYHGRGYRATSAPILAGAFRFDFADWGASRPYIDIGAVATPGQSFRFSRSYLFLGAPALGIGRTNGNSFAAFAKAGWVFRVSQRDELAAYGEVWRTWQKVDGYTEFGAPGANFVIPSTNDRMDVAKIGAKWTHLWGTSIETHLNVGLARTFNTSVGLAPALVGIGFTPPPPVRERTYVEYGLRVGYRITPKLVFDVFANGATGAGGGVNQVHGGVAVRYHY